MIVETKHQVVAVEVKTPVFRRAIVLGRTVATLISEETDMGYKTEFLAEIESDTGTESDSIFNSCVSVGTADAEINATVDKQIHSL